MVEQLNRLKIASKAKVKKIQIRIPTRQREDNNLSMLNSPLASVRSKRNSNTGKNTSFFNTSYRNKMLNQTTRHSTRRQFDFPEHPPTTPKQIDTTPQFPITATQALRYYKSKLSDWEVGEVLDYREIWFLGEGARKIRPNGQAATNQGFDNDRGDLHIVQGDHIAYQFEVLGMLGKGSFGRVLKVLDHRTGEEMALKIIRNKQRFYQQAQIEIKVLKFITDCDKDTRYNIVPLKQHFEFRGHVCLLFDLLHISLYDFLKANKFQGLGISLIRRFAIQILQSLRLLNRCKIIHCDLKPENVLLKQPKRSGVRVIDLGSSWFNNRKLYTYIQSRFYRAPEIILGIKYTMAIDMWSFGCMLAELYTGKPLFPGENEAEQLSRYIEVLGVPPDSMVKACTRTTQFFDGEGAPITKVTRSGKQLVPGSRRLEHAIGWDDMGFVDLIQKCLIWDPERRLRPDDAIRHPWIQEIIRERAQNTSIASAASASRCGGKYTPKVSDSKRVGTAYNEAASLPVTTKHSNETKFIF